MKTNRMIPILGIALLAASVYLLLDLRDLRREVLSVRCAAALKTCNDSCENKFRQDTTSLALQRSLAQMEHLRRMLDCQIQYINNPSARAQCQQEENDRYSSVLDDFKKRLKVHLKNFAKCKGKCKIRAKPCSNRPADLQVERVTFEIECIDDPLFPCFKKVDDICLYIQGVCDDCWLSFCPGTDFIFEAKGLQRVILEVTDGPAVKGKEVITSTRQGNSHLLRATEKIELPPGQMMLLRFIGDSLDTGQPIQVSIKN